MSNTIVNKLPKNSPFPYKPLSSHHLRILAMIFMLSDHLWASIIPGNHWMTDLGRLAFPIFASMIAEGYVHTSSVKKYLGRLLLFAVLSEIPFDLFYSSTLLDPFNQNVLFTFVWGLLCIIQIDKIKKTLAIWRITEKKAGLVRSAIGSCLLILLISLGAKLSFSDYKFWGYLTVVMFYVLRDFPFAWLLQLVAMVMLNWTLFQGEVTPIELFGKITEIPNQAYAIFALIPIWLYSGKKGRPLGKVMQYGFYAFYPIHMLILYAIWQMLSSIQ